MARKIPEEKKEEIKLKEDLEKLLDDSLKELKQSVISAKEILPPRNTTFMDYDHVKEYSDNNADNIVNSISMFYLNKNIIKEVEYVKQKSIVDKITVSNLLFQMKTAEHAIVKLLEEIDNGNLHPRTFEVLASLQKSKMEIVKHLSQFMVIMENNYKNLKEDYKHIKADDPILIDSPSQERPEKPNQVRGTKQLVELLRDVIPEKKASSIPNEIKDVTDEQG